MDLGQPGAILLISCYELGHQPIGIALPAGFLQQAGFSPLAMDVAVEPLDEDKATQASFVGICVPMHMALRMGVQVINRIRELNPDCHICCYGLYASLNSDYLLQNGVDSCIGGEYETPLVALVESLADGSDAPVDGVIYADRAASPYLERLSFAVPVRDKLPTLDQYAQLVENDDLRTAGYVEASRGCRHLCTHCPIPPVYEGRFFVVPQDIVLADIRQQVAAGATHITFGDPDFLNGPGHSLSVVEAMHEEFPSLTFDFTAKVQHLVQRGDNLPAFAEAGCLFIISAVESLSERVLKILDKQHTRADLEAALAACRKAGIAMRPTWVAFTPWTTLDDYLEMLHFVEANDLVDHVDPIQFAIRLLIPPGSWLADHPETLPHRDELDEAAFTYRWTHPDPRMDELHKQTLRLVEEDTENEVDPATTFFRLLELAHGREPAAATCSLPADRDRAPRMTESWFC